MAFKRASKRAASEASDSPEPKTKKAKGSAKAGPHGSKLDSKGEPYFELAKMRRVTVSEFKGKALVNIREYWEKDGDLLPGKKGISLTIEQYTALLESIPGIEALLKKQGEDVPRVSYDEPATSKADDAEDEKDKEESPKPSKSNIEATSDEDEG
ncbi:PC4-domain-containing protein [Pseudovirgaria hyperparasitica]|uniref:PC4-domain-containing protein n=1 Tax=Pseudovirgaria hyperparasitica TaxID=470096 RepID=A0A6A6VV75_9PEZI|nr:PC4-domain-containing protein [Pseudovirgaria hyperparasitica]KAF2753624.1 PC4-domain-containing protein [Pseudovirgaria hyperparasitica]